MELEQMLQDKLKTLESLKNKIKELDNVKQQLMADALEAQGAAKMLSDIVDQNKANKNGKESSKKSKAE